MNPDDEMKQLLTRCTNAIIHLSTSVEHLHSSVEHLHSSVDDLKTRLTRSTTGPNKARVAGVAAYVWVAGVAAVVAEIVYSCFS